MFWIWEGSHRMTTWRLHIDWLQHDYLNLLYYSDWIFLDRVASILELCFSLVLNNTFAFVDPLKITTWRPTTLTYCNVWRYLVSLNCSTKLYGVSFQKTTTPHVIIDIQRVHGLLLHWRLSNFYTPTLTNVIRTILRMVFVIVEHRPHWVWSNLK
jgi:hypothetical protein